MIRPALVAIASVAVLVAGCGGDEANDGNAAGAAEDRAMEKSEDRAMEKKEEAAAMKGDEAMEADEAMAAKKGAVVKVVSSQFGRVLADRRGQGYYLFDREKTKRSRCYGACAEAWPPVLTKGKPRAGKGARSRLLGTTKRRGGKLQVTYAGRPLYYYRDDAPGRILCHGVDEFGGLWLVVRPDGKPVPS